MKDKPAFPIAFKHGNLQALEEGMSMRQYYAAAALTGIMSNPYFDFEKMKTMDGGVAGIVTENAFKVADAMLEVENE